jgi:hypothetical protein
MSDLHEIKDTSLRKYCTLGLEGTDISTIILINNLNFFFPTQNSFKIVY